MLDCKSCQETGGFFFATMSDVLGKRIVSIIDNTRQDNDRREELNIMKEKLICSTGHYFIPARFFLPKLQRLVCQANRHERLPWTLNQIPI